MEVEISNLFGDMRFEKVLDLVKMKFRFHMSLDIRFEIEFVSFEYKYQYFTKQNLITNHCDTKKCVAINARRNREVGVLGKNEKKRGGSAKLAVVIFLFEDLDSCVDFLVIGCGQMVESL